VAALRRPDAVFPAVIDRLTGAAPAAITESQ
jgi:hypothetical protein